MSTASPRRDTRLFDDVQMVREQDRLNAVADRRERFEAVAGAGFVKACENVVANERRRPRRARNSLQYRQAVAQDRAGRARLRSDAPPAPSPRWPGKLRAWPRHRRRNSDRAQQRRPRQRCERLASARHQGVASRRAVVLERAAEQYGSRLQYRPTPGCIHEFGLCVPALLHRGLGADAAFEFPRFR